MSAGVTELNPLEFARAALSDCDARAGLLGQSRLPGMQYSPLTRSATQPVVSSVVVVPRAGTEEALVGIGVRKESDSELAQIARAFGRARRVSRGAE